MAQKANHHIVPQFYLRSFATGLDRRARITAFDSDTGESFATWVRNVGAVRHFNRIRTKDGEHSNALEDSIAEIESAWAPLFRDVVDAETFPSTLHREAILTLMATLSLRSGRFREVMTNLLTETHTMMMDVMLATKERWEAAHPDAEVPYEELKRFWDSREFDLTYEQTYFIGHELEAIEPVYKLLDRRNWCFVRAGGTNRFVTSDDPVILHDTKNRDPRPFFRPGHGMAETGVSFSLSPELLLHGRFEEVPAMSVATDLQVAHVNTLVAGHSRRHVFARDTLFSIATKDGIRPATELSRILKSRKEEQTS